MSVPGSRRRPSAEGHDPISLLQATIDREETRRRVRALRAAVAAVVVLAVIVVAAVLWRGEPAAADRAAVSPEARAQIAALAASAAAAEARAAEASASSSLPTTLAPTPTPTPTPAPAPEQSVAQPSADVKPSQSSRKSQRFPIAIGVAGYEPAVINASASSPIVLSVARGQGCAAGFLIPGLDVAQDNSAGPVTVSLGRVPAGSYQYSCGMEMVTGTLTVK